MQYLTEYFSPDLPNYVVLINRPAKGFTLVELLITLAILLIVMTMAVPSYRSFVINQQLSSTSSDFLVSMLQARSEAIRLGRPVSVLPENKKDWTSGWYLTQVSNTCEPVGAPFGKTAAPGSAVSISAEKTNKSFKGAAPSYTYSASGFPYTSCSVPYYSGAMNGTLAFQAVTTGHERKIIVANTGRARLCDPKKPPC